jgi:dTDP-4-amino-4,6-dideoxygalactose transaminase
VDSERETWNLDPALAIAEIRRRARTGLRQPKAIEVVHVLGHPARIDELEAEASAHGIPLIEDAAESLGARYVSGRFAGRSVGTIGLLGCFSFNGNKVITTGGGGMLTTDDPELARRARHLTTQARLPGIAAHHDEVGYNYRLSNLAAAVGLAQLESLPRFLDAKGAIAGRYDNALSRLGIGFPPRAEWARPSHWLYSVLIDADTFGCDRDSAITALDGTGIESRPIWNPLHTLGIYGDAPRLGTGAVAESLCARGLSLPCSVGLAAADQERVVTALASAAVADGTAEA